MTEKRDDGKNKLNREASKDTEIRREARRQRARERLGKNNPRCVRCGEDDPLTLELHHIAGREFDDRTAIFCRNCHRKLSDSQKDHPTKLTEIPDRLEVIAHWLLNLADFFELLIGKFREFADDLTKLADGNRDNLEPEK